jgi:uncharacterized membrane protein YtjA (UPF0391 family)
MAAGGRRQIARFRSRDGEKQAAFATGTRRNFRSDRGLLDHAVRLNEDAPDVKGHLSRQMPKPMESLMLGWVVTFLVVALIAGLLGFGGIAGASIEIAKIIFFIAIVLFLISAVVGLVRGRTRV